MELVSAGRRHFYFGCELNNRQDSEDSFHSSATRCAYDNNPDRDSLDGNIPSNTLPHNASSGLPPSPGQHLSKGINPKTKKKKAEEKEKVKDDGHKEEPIIPAYEMKRSSCSNVWVALSALYGQLVVLLALTFCLTEVMDNAIEPLQLQGIFLLFLYVGSIVAIMCIYISVVVDSCPWVTQRPSHGSSPLDPEVGSMGSLSTLRRAHISRERVSRTSFHLRVGALVFGLGTLVYNGLEIAMHSTLTEDCAGSLLFADPILQALFTFLQMHFLFVNSEVVVEKFGVLARFGFMHLVATNLAMWGRLVVWDGATDWFHSSYTGRDPTGVTAAALEGADYPNYMIVRREGGQVSLIEERETGCNHSSSSLGLPFVSRMLEMHSCFSSNALGRIWLASRQYLFPFIVQYSLIAAAVTYVMWRGVGKEKLSRAECRKLGIHGGRDEGIGTLDHRRAKQPWRTDCQSSSKGLFLGLLCLVGGIIVLTIFFVMQGREDFRNQMYWLGLVSNMCVMSLAIALSGVGFWQIPKLTLTGRKTVLLEKILSFCTVIGVQVFGIFGLIVGGANLHSPHHQGLFAHSMLLLTQASLQSMLLAESGQRTCTSRQQMLMKPGRQVITFLIFANITLWGLDSFMTQSSLIQQMHVDFYGSLAWGIIGRLAMPLMVFYRFYSCVLLSEIWKNTYKTKSD